MLQTSPDTLVEWFESPDVRLRHAAATAVRRLGHEAPGFVPHLLKAIVYKHFKTPDPEKQVRYAAAVSLGKIAPPAVEAVPDLVAHLERNDPRADVPLQRLIAWALGRMGNGARAAVPVLEELAERVFPPRFDGREWDAVEQDMTRRTARQALDRIAADAQPLATSFVLEPARKISVLRAVDVLVVGGGAAGMLAAAAAARHGAKTLLLEREHTILPALVHAGTAGISNFFRNGSRDEHAIIRSVGGLAAPAETVAAATAEHVMRRGYVDQLIAGLSWEFVQKLIALGGFLYRDEKRMLACSRLNVDPEVAQYGALTFLEEQGVEILVGTLACDPVMEGRRVKGCFIENKSGRQAVLADVVIDATGEADLATHAGAPVVMQPRNQGNTGSLLWVMEDFPGEPALPFRSGQDSANGPDPASSRAIAERVGFAHDRLLDGRSIIRYNLVGHGVFVGHMIDGSDGMDVALAEQACRKYAFEFTRFCREHVPGFQQAHLRRTGLKILWRGARGIVGDYHLTNDDMQAGKRFPDRILQARGYGAIGFTGSYSDVPYRMLLPQNVDGLLVAGKCASGANAVRETVLCMAMGEAAGTAAALAARKGLSPRAVEAVCLQHALRSQGALLDGSLRITVR